MTREKEVLAAVDWPFLGRVLLKTLLLLVACNLAFAAARPLEWLGQISVYNHVLPGRARLPYGEDVRAAHNLSLNNLPALFASHELSRPKAAGEFRVIVLGDSGIWGWLLTNDETLTGRLNALQMETGAGREIRFYNLGYPLLSVTKDLLILQEALAYGPDLIIWPVTLESFAPEKQLEHPIVQNNRARLLPLIDRHQLGLDPDDPRWVELTFWDETIVGRRRPLADLLRLQLTAIPWAATRVDQVIPDRYEPRANDLSNKTEWAGFEPAAPFEATNLAFDVMAAGAAEAGSIPILVINEPIYRADGRGSEVRYNSFYPRWAFDRYRALLAAEAAARGWEVVDLWDAVPPDEFSDTPVHLTPAGSEIMAGRVAELLKMRDLD